MADIQIDLPKSNQKEVAMRRLSELILAFRYRWNGFWVGVWLRALGCNVGKGFKCLRVPSFKDVPKGNIKIGSDVSIGRGVIFEIAGSGKLEIGDRCTVGDYSRFSTIDSIALGKSVAIAEQVSIRGSFHETARGQFIIDQGNTGAPISIGDDVLLGAQSVVLQGVEIPSGVMIGSKSLVTRSDKIHAYGIFAGSPLRHIRDRP
jgi:acetyltransferase-like isoleucine patch superfamily enzyme